MYVCQSSIKNRQNYLFGDIHHWTSINRSFCQLSDGVYIIHAFQVILVLQSLKGDDSKEEKTQSQNRTGIFLHKIPWGMAIWSPCGLSDRMTSSSFGVCRHTDMNITSGQSCNSCPHKSVFFEALNNFYCTILYRIKFCCKITAIMLDG